MTDVAFETREQWLIALTNELRPFFKSKGYTVPMKLRASCGYPATGGTRSKNPTIGMCHQATGSADKHYEIFIHPALDGEAIVAATLVHEILHACLPGGTGHKKPFARACIALGLEGKPTSTHAGEKLATMLKEITDKLGPYPHGALTYTGGKQTTRLLAVRCTECECVVRMTQKWIDEVGTPTCGCGNPMEQSDKKNPEMVVFKSVEQMVTYSTPDPRFEVRFLNDKRGQHWWLVDLEQGFKITPCEDKQDCLDTMAAIIEGMHVYDEVPVLEIEDEDVSWDDYGFSFPLGFGDDRHEFISDLADEEPDFPEDNEIETWTHPIKGTVVTFDYDEVSAAREASGARKSEQIGNMSVAAMD